jgi:bifunctional non-homologous end joining protein LigD
MARVHEATETARDALPAASEGTIKVGRRTLTLTRLDQRWWPAQGVRKRDVVGYYSGVAGVLLPHLAGRPFTIKRHYNGPRSPFVWIKDAPPELPEWVPRTPQPARSRHGAEVCYPLVQSVAALLWLIDFGCIDLHVWTSRRDLPDRPDYVLFDLDPHGVPFASVVEAAHLVREALDGLGLRSYPKTTGGDGLHVQVPIARRHAYEQVRDFARIVAAAVRRVSSGLITLEPHPGDRHGVYIDTKMNGHGQQIVSVYSVRPFDRPAVATPLTWDELDERVDPLDFELHVVLERVRRLGDLHEGVLGGKQLLQPALERISGG